MMARDDNKPADKADIRLLKADIRLLKADIEAVRSELNSETQSLRSELKSETQSLRSELKSETQSLRSELKSETQSLRSELKSETQKLAVEITKTNLRMDRMEERVLKEMRSMKADILQAYEATAVQGKAYSDKALTHGAILADHENRIKSLETRR